MSDQKLCARCGGVVLPVDWESVLADRDRETAIWKGEAANRSEAMVQLNLDRAALGVENTQLREALTYLESEARRIADMYQPASDGRNTFVIFADKIAKAADDVFPVASPAEPGSIRDKALQEAAGVAIHNSNFGHYEGNRRAFKIADEIRARMDKEPTP